MKLKELFIDWLTESRYIRSLEVRMAEQRADFTVRLTEKDTLMRSLRIELAQVKAENEQMRLVLMPLGSQAGRLYAAKFQDNPKLTVSGFKNGKLVTDELHVSTASLDWQGELNKMLQEEEDGIRSRGRVQEHESGADDGA